MARIFDTRNGFASGTLYGSKVYARFTIWDGGRYRIEAVIRTTKGSVLKQVEVGFGTALGDAVVSAFAQADLWRARGALVHAMGEDHPIVAHWGSIRRLYSGEMAQ